MNSLFQFPVPTIELSAILPILIVMITGIIALIVEMVRPKHNNDLIVGISIAGLVVAGLAAFNNLSLEQYTAFGEMVQIDAFSALMQFIAILGAILSIMFSEGYLREKRIPFGEIYPLMLWSTTGAMIMASTKNLLVIFVGLEILSVALYVLAGISRKEEKSNESALKYFLLGAFASGFLLYGISFLYGASGSLNLNDVILASAHVTAVTRPMLILGVGLMFIGLGFKASLVPFHQWTPDVYQGAPTNVTSFMATVSKVGAFAALVRVGDAIFPFSGGWAAVLAVIAVLTMTVGNLIALTQKDVKRILGYSSIAQAGYVMVAVLAHFCWPEVVGYGTIAYYLFGYSAMTAGAFAIVSTTARSGQEGTRLEDLHGLLKRSPLAAIALIIFVTSLIGLPPTAGFWGKLQIIRDISRSGLTWLAIVLAINSIISVYYYLAIAKAAIMPDESEAAASARKLQPGVVGACVLGVLGVVGAVMPPVVALFTGK